MSQPQTNDHTSTHPSAPPTPSREVLRHAPIRWLKPAGVGVLVLAVAVVGAGVLSRGMASQSLKNWTDAEAIPTVNLIRPDSALGGQILVLPGKVQAFFDAPIHARVSGYLKAWYDDIGAPVKAGQVLAVIDTPDLDQQFAQSRADLATAVANQKLAQTTATRWTILLGQDAVSRQEAEEKSGDLDAKTALVNAAKANVDRLAALESFKRIVAPFNGVVTARTTDIGQLITVGNPSDPGLFTVADTHRLRIYVSVPQAYTAQIHPGETVTLAAPENPGRTFTATLVTSADAIGAQSGALLTEAQIDNPDGALKPGDFVQVTFSLPSAAGVLRLPASALTFRDAGMMVAVLGPDDRAVLKHVSVARDLGSAVEIASGLAPGDRVIDNPPDSIVTGERVRVAAGPAAARVG
ncbi:MAG TPA: efflux RND transporter periplasmic adaptor subunit [Caulobacteraceae bacterium]|jgi:RND family efflux transporter MFP subunit|nr:efflux RND transporter periplasmic adaptor subunit [Caulobacteraceae bacterium]